MISCHGRDHHHHDNEFDGFQNGRLLSGERLGLPAGQYAGRPAAGDDHDDDEPDGDGDGGYGDDGNEEEKDGGCDDEKNQGVMFSECADRTLLMIMVLTIRMMMMMSSMTTLS